jgi:hypothetical protein
MPANKSTAKKSAATCELINAKTDKRNVAQTPKASSTR